MVLTRLWLLAVLTCVVVVACERVPLTAPTSSTISVTIDQGTLPLNGQAQVRAIVIESAGTPVHNGTEVSFSTTLGSFSPPSASTVNGVATSTFFAGGISGTTRINAYSGGASTGAGNASSGGVEVKIGAAAAGSIALQVVPSAVPQNGGTVQATALVMDPSGNPLPGVPVLFSADAGTLSAATVVTDANGYAVTNLVTTRTATITARAGTATPATFSVGVNAPATVGIELVTTAPSVNQPVAFRLTVPSATNSSPIASVTVDLGDGNSRVFGSITGPIGFTHTYGRAGGYTVTARSTDINGGTGVSSVSLVVGFETLPTVSVTASPNPTSISSAVQQGVVTFTVTAAASSPSAPLRSVRLTLADGTVLYSGTGSGSAAHRFTAAGTYTVTATATDALGATATTSSTVVVSP